MKKTRFFILLLAFVLVFSLFGRSNAKETESEPDLTIAMKSPSMNFVKLVNRYKNETGKKVKIMSGSDLDTKLNMELLSGEGPDLIQGTEIPYWLLAERGALADIAELIENDPDMSMDDFFENIINPLKDEEGHLYIMPCSFIIFFAMINEQLFEKAGISIPEEWTLENLIETCIEFTKSEDKPSDTYAMFWGNEVLSMAVKDELMSAIDFSGKTSNMDMIDDLILEYLAEPSIISSNNTYANPMTALYDISPYLYFTETLPLLSYICGATAIIFENDQYEVRNFPRSKHNQGEYFYRLEYAFCINKAGNVDEAWQFMKYLLSEEVQTGSVTEIYVFDNPVNKKAAEKRIDMIRDDVEELVRSIKEGSPKDRWLEQSKHSPDEYMTHINRFIDTYIRLRDALTTPVIVDAVLEESLLSAIERVGGDNFDASKVRKEVSRIVDVYMNEEGGDIQTGYIVIYIILGGIFVITVSAVIIVTIKRRRNVKRAASGVAKGE